MLVFNAGLFAPEIIRVDRAQVQEQIVSAYRKWHAIYLDRHAFEPENIRFVHDPDWRNKFFSIQSAHDGNHFIWRATSIVVAFAQGMFSPFGI